MKCQKIGCKKKAEYWYIVFDAPEGEDEYKVHVCKEHLLENFMVSDRGNETLLKEHRLKEGEGVG